MSDRTKCSPPLRGAPKGHLAATPLAADSERRAGPRLSRAPFDLSRIPVYPPPLQPLEVGAVDDPLEREADRAADRVMRAAPAPVQGSSAPAVQRACAECAKDDDTLRRALAAGTAGATKGGAAPSIVHEVLAAPGQPLDAPSRAFFEGHFGRDLSGVRLHTDARAAESAAAVQAAAYTVGPHVVMGAGRHAPGTASGRRLLAHELAHVVQQSGAGGVRVQRAPPAPTPTTQTPAPKTQTPPTPPPTPGDKNEPQVDPVHEELKRIATAHMLLAYTAFAGAISDVKVSVKAEAAARAQWAALMVDVAMGFLIPGLGKSLVNAVNQLPIHSPDVIYKIAIAVNSTDNAKSVLTGITKTVANGIKSNRSLFGDTTMDAFLTQLDVQIQNGFQAVIDDMDALSNTDLGVLATAYDATITNRQTYAEEIKRLADAYQNEVEEVGDFSGLEGSPMTHVRAFWILDAKTNLAQLAICNYFLSPGFFGVGSEWSRPFFERWVDPELYPAVLAKTAKANADDPNNRSDDQPPGMVEPGPPFDGAKVLLKDQVDGFRDPDPDLDPNQLQNRGARASGATTTNAPLPTPR